MLNKINTLVSKIQVIKQKNRSLALDIGEDSIKLVELVQEGETVKLSNIDLVKLPAAQAEGSSSERAQVLKTLIANLFTKHKISPKDLVLGISGQAVFIKFLEILPVSKEKIEQTIKYEAQQQIPFSLDEVEWDAHLFDQHGETEAPSAYRVLLVAIKKDNLTAYANSVEQMGLTPSILDVSTLALYNCCKFNHDYDEKKLTAVIDIGAKSTDLLILEGDTFWMRNFAVGGANITDVLEKKFKISTSDAEKLKTRMNIDSSDIKEAIKPVLDDLYGEIARSIDYYYFQRVQSQDTKAELRPSTATGANHIDEILLSGGAALLSGLDNFLAEKFSCPIRRLEPLKMFRLDEEVKTKINLDNQVLFSQVIGLALRGLNRSAVNINLLKEKLRAKNMARQRVGYGIGSVILAIFILFGASGFMRQDYRVKNMRLKKLKNLLATFDTYQPQIEKLQTEASLLTRQVDILGELAVNRALWLDVLAQLQKMLPNTLWTTDFSGTIRLDMFQEKLSIKLALQGKAESYEGVNNFVAELKSSTLFKNVKPLSSSFIEEEARNKERVEVVKFSISMKVEPEKFRDR